MTGKTDIIKGRIKEAAGVLTGNEKLQEQGRVDQEVGNVKEAANEVVRDAKDAAHTAIEKAKHVAQQTVQKVKDAAKNVVE
jgi:uncharacterized protein YjbJ (UPF0337 family)